MSFQYSKLDSAALLSSSEEKKVRAEQGCNLKFMPRGMWWIVLKQEEVVTRCRFLQIIMPLSTFHLVNWKEAEQITPQNIPSLPSNFILFPDLSSLHQHILGVSVG